MKNRKQIVAYISLFTVVFLIMLPVFILYKYIPFQNSWWPSTTLLTTLGKLTGLIGLSAFAMSLFLASRFVWLDKLFYGLPKVINIHRYLGISSFVLIIMHPILLAIKLLPTSPQAPFQIFMLWGEASYMFGYISILLFMFLIVATFFARMKYERLKTLHSYLSIPLMLGGVHSILIDSDIQRINFLAWYYIILITVSVATYFARLVFVDYGIKTKKFVISNIQLSHNNTKITLTPKNKKIDVQPGQFIFISFDSLSKGEEHPFSVSDIGENGTFSIIVKSLGDFTKDLQKLKTGEVASIDGPYGTFGELDEDVHRHVWIAGGIGVTPFISMAQDFSKQGNKAKEVDLFYSVRSDKDFMDLDMLQNIASQNENFKLDLNVSEKNGMLDIDRIKKYGQDLTNCHFHICGPPAMVHYFVSALKKEKVSNERINIEAFNLL